MANYRIYKPANDTLDDVWNYSLENWGEAKAEEYINGLFDTIQKAADKEIFWRAIKDQTKLDAYFVKYQRHYIFFKKLEDNLIGVISIIHDRRNIVSVLEKEMKQVN